MHCVFETIFLIESFSKIFKPNNLEIPFLFFVALHFMEMNGIKMKRRSIILGVLASLCLLGTSYNFWTLYNTHCKQVEEWKEEAKASFEEALWMEVDKRSDIPFYSVSSGERGITTLRTRIPDSVSVMTVNGFKKYKIDRKKYDQSLAKETNLRANLSTLLNFYPLSVDTLAMYWDSLMAVKGIYLNNQICYVYTDLELQNDTCYSKKDYSCSNKDSLTTIYMGFRCEHELTAYTSYPYWLFRLSFVNWCWLLLPWVVLILVIVYYVPMERFFRGKFIKEREVHVADVKLEKAQTFLLPDGSVFDSFECTLTKGDQQYRLSNQSAILLKLFLRKSNHRLSSADIDLELWNGKGTADQLYKAIQRLRVGLKNVSSDLVIKSINGVYELK